MSEEITPSVFRKCCGWLSWRLVALVAAFLLFAGDSYANSFGPQNLIGLQGTGVIVENLAPEAGNLGLSKTVIQTDVELRLRKAGVKVLTEEESLETLGIPCLYVKINARSVPGLPLVVFSIAVELREWVRLVSGLETVAAIWHTAYLGTVEKEKIRTLREEVGHQVDVFIKDYLAANPK